MQFERFLNVYVQRHGQDRHRKINLFILKVIFRLIKSCPIETILYLVMTVKLAVIKPHLKLIFSNNFLLKRYFFVYKKQRDSSYSDLNLDTNTNISCMHLRCFRLSYSNVKYKI